MMNIRKEEMNKIVNKLDKEELDLLTSISRDRVKRGKI